MFEKYLFYTNTRNIFYNTRKKKSMKIGIFFLIPTPCQNFLNDPFLVKIVSNIAICYL